MYAREKALVCSNACVENILGGLGICGEVYDMHLERESRRGQAPAQLSVQQSLKLQSMKKNNRERYHCFHFKSGNGRES